MYLLTTAEYISDSTNLFLGLHILLNLLALFVISWVFYELHSENKSPDTFSKAKFGMITFLVLLAFAWITAIAKNNDFVSVAVAEKQNLFLFMLKIKKMFYLLLPFYSFIVYLQLGYASLILDNAAKQKMIVKIKWQVLTIALLLTILIMLGYLAYSVFALPTGGYL